MAEMTQTMTPSLSTRSARSSTLPSSVWIVPMRSSPSPSPSSMRPFGSVLSSAGVVSRPLRSRTCWNVLASAALEAAVPALPAIFLVVKKRAARS
ncbi:MAG: hypothetical protein HC900_13205 [Methylacidiphilales bacterium]|nr:hypothetical protein [Candidatus Methylacidiphilales bacterium]